MIKSFKTARHTCHRLLGYIFEASNKERPFHCKEVLK